MILDQYSFFKVPEGCTKETCPYICEEFITPKGINIDEMFTTNTLSVNKKSDEITNKPDFLSLINEDFKVVYTNSDNAIFPEDISTGFDTTSETPEDLVIEISEEE